ncbi:thioredoxin family protein [Aurantibacillus circumpalustris]|uniref:thioredoxin family protein n=1 Tax=Aurantibacillus circumpalustris TaxID=3036359 RepID=UPI00295BCC97|nr:thioredoxin family protein [Aurantibacillus circumpalustris]
MKFIWSLLFFLFYFSSYSQDTQQDSAVSEGPIGMTVEQFNRRIKTTNKLLLVYFSADWCVVCKRQKPVLHQVFSEIWKDAELLSINLENNPLIAEYFEIDALPALILYKDGYMVWNRVGFQEKEKILDLLKGYIKR